MPALGLDALGDTRLLTGHGAVALMEAAISEGLAGKRVRRPPTEPNVFGRRPLGVDQGRATLSFAAGLLDTGLRAAALVTGPELPGLYRDLEAAVSRRLALVVHAAAASGGHRPLHAVAGSGVFQLVSGSAQEAVDFTLIAHRVAELSLTPGVHLMDGEETADALGPASLPAADAIRSFVGDPDDEIDCPSPAQAALFGKRRRRIPDWFSHDVAVLQGASRDSGEEAVAEAANNPFFLEHVPALLARAMHEFADRCGRSHAPVAGRHLDDADHVIVATGATARLVESVVEHLRATERARIGSLRINLVNPFPAADVAAGLAGKKTVTVLDRGSAAFTGTGPLAAAVDAALGRGKRPLILAGAHDRPLSAAEVAAVVQNMTSGREARTRFVLGVDFPGTTSSYPKREIAYQRLRRDYPELGARSLEDRPALDVRPPGRVTLHLDSAQARTTFPAFEEETAAMLARALDAAAVGRPISGALESARRYQITLAGDGAAIDPGRGAPAEIVVALDRAVLSEPGFLGSLADRGTLLLIGDPARDRDGTSSLSGEMRERLREKNAAVLVLESGAAQPETALTGLAQGAVLAAVLSSGRLQADSDRAIRRLGEGLDREEARLAAIRTGLERTRTIDPAALGESTEGRPPELPLRVRRFRDGGPPLSRVSRFWSETAPDYVADRPARPAADPFRGVDVLPPATAMFFDETPAREQVPRWLASKCTGCGQCLVDCPHSALVATVIGPEALLTAGLELAAESGTPLIQLTPAVRPMAQFLARAGKKDEIEGETTDGVLGRAFDRWLEQKDLAGDKLAETRAEFERLRAALADIPLAATEFFFRNPEALSKGSGELFTLTIDPTACTGCRACVAACPEAALEAVASTPAETTRLRERYRRWEALPDTKAETIRRAAADAGYETIASYFLSRSFGLTLTGGDRAAPGCGERSLLRRVASTVEALVQPRVHELVTEIRDLTSKLTDAIRGLFGDALPVDDLDALSRGLSGRADRPLHLDDLIDRLGDAGRHRPVDQRRLARLIELTRALRDLEWVLTEGPSGLGRARVGLATAGEALGWGRHSPRNPFTFPVAVHWSEDSADFAAGLCLGGIRHALDNLRLVRRARLEAAGRYDPKKHDPEIAALDWTDLTDEEWGAVPPLILVGDESVLAGRGRDRLAALLEGPAPVKVIVVDRREDPGADAADDDPGRVVGDGLFALAHRDAYVLRASTANPGHLLAGLIEGLSRRRPALFHLHAPNPLGDGFSPADAREQARMALDARVFPCVRYDPDAAGVFGLRLSLEGNPEPEADFAARPLTYRDGDEDRTETVPVTLADWAYGQSRFRRHFTPVAAGAGGIAMSDYLTASAGERAGRSPFIRTVDEEGRLVHLRVSEAMTRAGVKAHEAWRILQELAGVKTPFTEVLRTRLEQAIAEERRAELDRVKTGYEEKLHQVEQEHRQRAAEQLRERLLKLAGYGRSARPDEP